jgi:hypothetical protein
MLEKSVRYRRKSTWHLKKGINTYVTNRGTISPIRHLMDTRSHLFYVKAGHQMTDATSLLLFGLLSPQTIIKNSGPSQAVSLLAMMA